MDLENDDFWKELKEDGRRFVLCIEPLERFFKDTPHEIYSVYKNGENGDRDNEYFAVGFLFDGLYLITFKLWNDNVFIREICPYQDPDEYLPI